MNTDRRCFSLLSFVLVFLFVSMAWTALQTGVVDAKPDLSTGPNLVTVTDLDNPDGEMIAGDRILINVTVVNTGDVGVNVNVTVYQWDLSDVGGGEASKEKIGTFSLYVPAYDSNTSGIIWDTDPTQKGRRAVLVVVDEENAVPEYNEENNQVLLQVILTVPSTWSFAFKVMTIGMLMVFVSLSILALVLWITGKIITAWESKRPKKAPAPKVEVVSEGEEEIAVVVSAVSEYLK